MKTWKIRMNLNRMAAKRVGLFLVLTLCMCIIFWPLFVLSAPFLVCDAYPPVSGVIGFKGILDSKPFDTPYSLHISGAAIVYDLGLLDDGQHNFTEIRAYNVRGESKPIPFVLPVLPGLPTGVRVVK